MHSLGCRAFASIAFRRYSEAIVPDQMTSLSPRGAGLYQGDAAVLFMIGGEVTQRLMAGNH